MLCDDRKELLGHKRLQGASGTSGATVTSV